MVIREWKGYRKLVKKNGFTAMELLIVLAIILTLVGIGIPAYNSWRNRGKIARARAEIANIEMAAEMYKTDYGVYPDSLGILQGALQNIKISNQDPWGNAYGYNPTGETIEITSNGPNKAPGDEDDISNESTW